MASVENASNAVILPGSPVCNRVIHITIDGLLALDGSELNGEITSFFTTCFDPFYSNAMRVRLLAGEFLGEVPDDTINQIVWYMSREADLKNYRPAYSKLNPVTYNNYRSRWTTAATILHLLSGTSVNGSLMKRLGDLSIARKGAAGELLKLMREELMYLTAILEDGGKYGREMETVTKSGSHPDAPTLSRTLALEDLYSRPAIPGANTRRQFVRSTDNGKQTKWKRTWGTR